MAYFAPMFVAILTGDLVSSTKLPASQRSASLVNLLQGALETTPFELSQGDSFQLRAAAVDGLSIALRLRSHLRSISRPDGYRPDARVSIGLGTVEFTGASLSESAGPAFEFSGRGLVGSKRQPALLQITSPDIKFNMACNTALTLAESIIQRWTVTQALVIEATLAGLNQQQIADSRGVKQPAVQQQLQAAGWPGINSLLTYYSTNVKSLFAV